MGLNSSGLMYMSRSVSREEKRKRPSVPRVFSAESCLGGGAGLSNRIPTGIPNRFRHHLPEFFQPIHLPNICPNATSARPRAQVPRSHPSGSLLHSEPSSTVHSPSARFVSGSIWSHPLGPPIVLPGLPSPPSQRPRPRPPGCSGPSRSQCFVCGELFQRPSARSPRSRRSPGLARGQSDHPRISPS